MILGAPTYDKLYTQTSHPKNIYNHNNIAVMQLLTFRTDRQN